jgi:hypothetical protein
MTRRTTSRALAVLARFGRRITDIAAECHYAQRRAITVMTSPDTYLAEGNKAPDNYAEFLFRTSSQLRHEPAAAGRASGRPVG